MNINNELATKWYPDTLIGLAVIVGFFVSNLIFYMIAIHIISNETILLLSSQIFSIIVLISFFNIQKKKLYPNMRFIGEFDWHDYRVCLLIFIIITFIQILFSLLFSIPDETFFDDLINNKSQTDIVFICITIIFLAPVIEEILFRHFILAMFPFNLGGKWAAYAIVFSSLLFSLAHTQYVHIISAVFIFILGGILALSRIVSQGLLLPILLHMTFNFISIFWYFLFNY